MSRAMLRQRKARQQLTGLRSTWQQIYGQRMH
ncbi:hypothetical protein EV644_103375 [Kribbella orskensis]|uniref:Uncharacterized protein n=1 Tax=Kribbella orskensis TaxID=2512216 RepID=A0ABY2BQT7_9ACTN|nr:hypothetical protein EV644_103375 [Kribbella orskensis]